MEVSWKLLWDQLNDVRVRVLSDILNENKKTKNDNRKKRQGGCDCVGEYFEGY